jgi:hypothetical protein
MPKQKLTDRQFISGVTLADLLHFVVTGDTSQNPAGSSYKGSVEQLFNTFSSFTCTYPLIVDTVNSCSGSITINGDVTINGSATTINTQIIQSQDNNIVLNYSGTHLTAIGGGITLEDGQSNGVDSIIYTDSNGTWLFDPGLSASTGTIDDFTANTISVTTIGSSGDCVDDLYLANLYGCSPIIVWDNLTLSGSVIDAQGGGYLNLRYNNDGIFYLGNDNGNYSDTFIYGENGYLEISSYDPSARINIFTDGGNAGFVLTNDTTFYTNDISIYTDTTSILSTPVAGDGNNILEINNDNILLQGNTKLNVSVGNHSPVGIGSAVSDLLIAVVTGTSYTTDSLRETNPSILSSQYSTIQTGIKNSVALGGYNLNINSDNTAFVDNLNINTIGSGNSIFNLGLDSSGNVVTGVTTTDTYVTGGTYLNGTTTFTNNTGGTFNVSGFTQPFTGNTSASCITDLYVSNIHSCSPLNINPLNEGNVYFGSTSGVTIDVINNRIGINTTTPIEELDVSGNTKISGSLNIGTILSGTPIINLGLDSNGNVVTGTTGTFTGNTSGITNPSAINVIATDGTPTTSSGSLTPLISSQVLIPANTLSTNCVLEIVWSQFRVSGATGTIQSTIYISTTSGTLGSAPSVGSTLIATGPNLTSTNFSVQGRRDLNKQGVDGKIMNATGSFNSDGTPSGAITTFTIDNSNDVYLQFCTGSTGAGDTSNIRGVRVTQYKQL